MYLGFIATVAVLSGQGDSAFSATTETSGILLFAAATLVIAYVGYRFDPIRWVSWRVWWGLSRLSTCCGKISAFPAIGDLLSIRPFS